MTTDSLLDRRAFHPGQRICAQGDPADCAFYVESGTVEVVAEDDEGNRVVVATMGPESVFGEMALVTDQPRSATVRAKEPTTVRVITKKDFTKRLDDADKVTRTLVNLMINRIVETNERMLEQYREIVGFEDRARAALHKIKMAPEDEAVDLAKDELQVLLNRLVNLMDRLQG